MTGHGIDAYTGHARPAASITHGLSRSGAALRQLMQACHIGKVVIKAEQSHVRTSLPALCALDGKQPPIFYAFNCERLTQCHCPQAQLAYWTRQSTCDWIVDDNLLKNVSHTALTVHWSCTGCPRLRSGVGPGDRRHRRAGHGGRRLAASPRSTAPDALQPERHRECRRAAPPRRDCFWRDGHGRSCRRGHQHGG